MKSMLALLAFILAGPALAETTPPGPDPLASTVLARLGESEAPAAA